MTDSPTIISREDARAAGLKRFFAGKKLCKRGHVSERKVSNGQCIACDQEGARKRHAANPDKQRERNRKARSDDPEKVREQNRKWRANNPDKCREQKIKYRANNPEKVREQNRKWRAANRAMLREYDRQYRKDYPEKAKRWGITYRANNKDKIQKHNRKIYGDGSTERLETMRKLYAEDPAKYRGRVNGYYKANPEKYRAQARQRRLTKLGRLKAFWGMIKKRMGLKQGARQKLLIYDAETFQAHLVSTLPGEMTYAEAVEEGYQHDHIVPISYISKNFPFDIACKMVVDLDNLRFIPATENMQKHSKMGEPYQLKVLGILKERHL